jgi:hypothetical protein
VVLNRNQAGAYLAMLFVSAGVFATEEERHWILTTAARG